MDEVGRFWASRICNWIRLFTAWKQVPIFNSAEHTCTESKSKEMFHLHLSQLSQIKYFVTQVWSEKIRLPILTKKHQFNQTVALSFLKIPDNATFVCYRIVNSNPSKFARIKIGILKKNPIIYVLGKMLSGFLGDLSIF